MRPIVGRFSDLDFSIDRAHQSADTATTHRAEVGAGEQFEVVVLVVGIDHRDGGRCINISAIAA